MLHHEVDYTPYEGMAVTGWPVTTLLRGERVWDRGELLGRPGQGRFLRCGKPDMARPRVQETPAAGPYMAQLPDGLGLLARRSHG
jgi:dihydropyrimidinase